MESLRVFHNLELMAKEISFELKVYADQAEKDGNIFSIVLSGGSSGTRLYGEFVKWSSVDKIPWHIVHFFWADERCVYPENEESNYGTCRSILLDHISIPKENIHRIRGEGDPLKESVRYAREIQNHMEFRKKQPNLFDWVFLGVGADGHTASLFSGHDSLNSSNLCEMVRHPQTWQMRVTMTPFAIKQSNRIIYHVIGREKSGIISELVSQIGSYANYPAAHIPGEWYLDSAAASKLNPKTTGLNNL